MDARPASKVASGAARAPAPGLTRKRKFRESALLDLILLLSSLAPKIRY